MSVNQPPGGDGDYNQAVDGGAVVLKAGFQMISFFYFI
jgi:hypothetical protein